MSTHGECRKLLQDVATEGGGKKKKKAAHLFLSSFIFGSQECVSSVFCFLPPEVLLFDCMYLMLTLGLESPITSSSAHFRLFFRCIPAHTGNRARPLVGVDFQNLLMFLLANLASAVISRLLRNDVKCVVGRGFLMKSKLEKPQARGERRKKKAIHCITLPIF